ncbi:c-type cytochrome [Neptuniibacter caesariensis]|uniref:Cytochrome c domain-containing protein n=1 Tax=Neptuniibacter caesariensis TaxID=207954 RepID=A0A7U8GRF6_NEPCE|nr:c-type cytochrome [Neptuniibacter caesariensis]EAR61317.1 hypothetical protein MED92_11339 [Oceanospirillum sp. MED92] [Neptuniibacter caesariensis]
MNPSLKAKATIKFFVLATALSASPMLLAEGNPTFEKVCSSCHTGGFKGWVTGAPNIHKKEEWSSYLDRDSVERMKEIVLKGAEDHKVKGGCSTCSNGSILNAVDYIISEVR